MREVLYQHRYESKPSTNSKENFKLVHVGYTDDLKSLYIKILTLQATCVCFLSQNTISRITLDMVQWNAWNDLLEAVKDQESVLKATEEQWRDMRFQEECDKQMAWHPQKLAGLNAAALEVSRLQGVVNQAQINSQRRGLLMWLSSEESS